MQRKASRKAYDETLATLLHVFGERTHEERLPQNTGVCAQESDRGRRIGEAELLHEMFDRRTVLCLGSRQFSRCGITVQNPEFVGHQRPVALRASHVCTRKILMCLKEDKPDTTFYYPPAWRGILLRR